MRTIQHLVLNYSYSSLGWTTDRNSY